LQAFEKILLYQGTHLVQIW